MNRYIIEAVCEGVCPESGLTVGRCNINITFAHHRETGDGWNEPIEAEHAEFVSAEVRGRPVSAELTAWAEWWLEQNQLAALVHVIDERLNSHRHGEFA